MTYAVTAWALPPKAETGYKKWFNRENFFFTFTVVEAANVGNNWRIGAGITF